MHSAGSNLTHRVHVAPRALGCKPLEVFDEKGFAGLLEFLQSHFERHYLPLSAVGYGLADTTTKASKMLAAIKLETGGLAALDSYRSTCELSARTREWSLGCVTMECIARTTWRM